MAELRFDIDWLSTGEADAVLRDTSARLVIQFGDCCLTRNLDTWSKTVRDSVLVSAYPLALWFASSWWRLNFEPLPASGSQPDVDWRMAHELAAANHGYVWPEILFASDGENINLWARHTDTTGQSVNYLYDLDGPRHVPLADFQRSVTSFIEAVLHRTEAVGCGQTDLASLWHLICDDMSNPSLRPVRMLEAQMGFDPEECPEPLITRALFLRDETGPGALSELAPIFGRRNDGTALDQIEHLPSVRGSPQRIPRGMFFSQGSMAPWQQGVEAARSLRSQLGNEQQPITNKHLLDLRGLTQNQDENWQPAGKTQGRHRQAGRQRPIRLHPAQAAPHQQALRTCTHGGRISAVSPRTGRLAGRVRPLHCHAKAPACICRRVPLSGRSPGRFSGWRLLGVRA